MMKRIKRRTVIEAVEAALRETYIDAADRRRVRKAAKTVTRYAVGNWWDAERNCGCIVAEAFPDLIDKESSSSHDLPTALSILGSGIDAEICDRRRDLKRESVVAVVA